MTKFEQVAREHRALYILIDRARAVAGAPPDTLSTARWLSLLDHEVRCLASALERHFAMEERGGYLRDVVERCPHLASSVQSLGAQHAVLRAQVGSIATGLSASPDPERAKAQLRALASSLEAHERGEHEVLQAALDRGVISVQEFVR